MCTRKVCLGHVMTRLLESRREPVMLPNAQRPENGMVVARLSNEATAESA